MLGRLQGKVCVVTCGSSGMGLATAKRFADEGARVFIIGRQIEDLDQALFEIGGKVTALRSDPDDGADLKKLIDAVEKSAGRIDVLYLDANMFGGALPIERRVRQCDRSLTSLVDAVRASVRLMPKGSSIVMTGSPPNDAHSPGVLEALRAAIGALAKGWAAEFRDKCIRVNVVSPKCPDHADSGNHEALNGGHRNGRGRSGLDFALSREKPARDVANCLLFLASDESSCVTGTELFLDDFEWPRSRAS